MRDVVSQQISHESLNQFQRDGFAIERSLVSPEFCARLRGVVEQHLEWLSGQIEFEADLQYPGAPESLEAEGGRTPRRLKQAMSRDTIFAELVMLPEVSQ